MSSRSQDSHSKDQMSSSPKRSGQDGRTRSPAHEQDSSKARRSPSARKGSPAAARTNCRKSKSRSPIQRNRRNDSRGRHRERSLRQRDTSRNRRRSRSPQHSRNDSPGRNSRATARSRSPKRKKGRSRSRDTSADSNKPRGEDAKVDDPAAQRAASKKDKPRSKGWDVGPAQVPTLQTLLGQTPSLQSLLGQTPVAAATPAAPLPVVSAASVPQQNGGNVDQSLGSILATLIQPAAPMATPAPGTASQPTVVPPRTNMATPTGRPPVFDQTKHYVPCKLFELGICNRGDNCPLSHASGAIKSLCNEFQKKGFCSRGERCMFEHGPDQSKAQASFLQAEPEAPALDFSDAPPLDLSAALRPAPVLAPPISSGLTPAPVRPVVAPVRPKGSGRGKNSAKVPVVVPPRQKDIAPKVASPVLVLGPAVLPSPAMTPCISLTPGSAVLPGSAVVQSPVVVPGRPAITGLGLGGMGAVVAPSPVVVPARAGITGLGLGGMGQDVLPHTL